MPPYELALREILSSPGIAADDIEDKSVSCNLLFDERVRSNRENELFEYADGVIPRPDTGDALKRSVKQFFEKRIRTAAVPDYVRPGLNRHNFVSVASGLNPSCLNPTLELVSVLDLSGLKEVYLFAQQQGFPGFEDYEAEASRDGISKYVEKRISNGADEARGFIGVVLQAIHQRGRVAPFGPVWALWWDEFKPYINDSAERWLQLLGMSNRHRDDRPHWLIALRYPLSALGQVARPTQVDAGWSPLHFPSPAQKDANKGGHPMDLSMPPRRTVLLSEFIHQQVMLKNGAWTCLPNATASRVAGDLVQQRKAHHARLLHFNNGLSFYGWIGACVQRELHLST